MALTCTVMMAPGGTLRHQASGRTYTASSTGFISGIVAADAVDYQADFLQFNHKGFQRGAMQQQRVVFLFWAGATTDRPKVTGQGTTGITNPPPAIGTAFSDSTTSSVVYFVGNLVGTTGWVDGTGAAA
jgi:hypothetical protein